MARLVHLLVQWNRPRRGGWLPSFRLARTVDTVEAVTSGNSERMARRGKNLLLGRAMARGAVLEVLVGGQAVSRTGMAPWWRSLPCCGAC